MIYKKLGLIGKNISYSFSKNYFEDKFKKLGLKDFSYDLFDLNEVTEVESIFKLENLVGFNVTQPYKVDVIPYLDELSEEAEKIGAVNTILLKNGRKIGYNTDAFAFEKSLLILKKEHHQKALILGNGGASKAVQFVLNKLNIPFQIVCRNCEFNFENFNIETVSKHHLIIQTTPVGTFPNIIEHVPFPFEALTKNHLVIDIIYNPEETEFLKKASSFGAKTMNGKYMLEQQAEKAWQIWHS